MWSNALKAIGLAPVGDYIHPRISIGKMVLENEFSTGHFKVQVDSQALVLRIKNNEGKIIWQSIHNEPFLTSTQGMDEFNSTPTNPGIIHIVEHDTLPTRLQTITKIAYDPNDKKVINIYGGLGAKLVLPTHMDYIISFKEITPQQLELSINITRYDPSMENYKRLILTSSSRKEEQVYGFGEQYTTINHKKHKIPIFIRKQDNGKNASAASSVWSSTLNLISGEAIPSKCTAPFYFTNDLIGFYLTNKEYASFDFKDENRTVIRLNSTTMTGRLIHAPSMLDILTEYTIYSGRMNPIPTWVNDGIIVGLSGGQDKIRQIITHLRDYNVPLSAVYINDWSGYQVTTSSYVNNTSTNNHNTTNIKQPLWTLNHDSTIYPDWNTWIYDMMGYSRKQSSTTATLKAYNEENEGDISAQQHQQGINLYSHGNMLRILVNISPFITNVPATVGEGGDNNNVSLHGNFFEQAKKNGYLIESTLDKNNNNNSSSISPSPYLYPNENGYEVGLIDLTNPDARQWYKNIIKEQILNNGLSGYMADDGYSLPVNPNQIKFYNSADPLSYHNQYAEEWTSLQLELFNETNINDDSFFFIRSGYTQSPGKVQSLCVGNHAVSWDQHEGMKSGVTAMISSGMSGFSVSYFDGGSINSQGNLLGSKMSRTRDILYRWMEIAAFSPLFFTSEGLIPSMNAQFYDDEETYLHLAHTAKIYQLLAPYRKQLYYEARKKGWPLIRHLLFYYPQDEKVSQLTYQQYLLGEGLLIAPSFTSTSFVKVYFPKDDNNISWRHIWSNNVYEAGTYQAIDTPIGQPAIFIKEPFDEISTRSLNDLLKFASNYFETHVKK
ncbi:unnamed protein product [Cunninghamella echinulata]